MIVLMILIITAESYTPPRSVGFIERQDIKSHQQGRTSVQILNTLRSEISLEIFNNVKRYSDEFGIDYRLVLAVIKHESQFNPDATSSRGAEGLMQLMPVTHAEIVEKLDNTDTVQEGNNIRNGIYYLSRLFDLFSGDNSEDRLCLTLAAYNAGPSRIYNAQELAAYLGENPNDWSVIEKIMPLLSKRYYSLHQMVWITGKPPSGSFGSWRQTIAYVQNIQKTYQEFKKIN